MTIIIIIIIKIIIIIIVIIIKSHFHLCLEKKRMNLLVFTLHFCPKDLVGEIIKMIINTITQIGDKAANATQDQLDFER